jgi:hypothetical protein
LIVFRISWKLFSRLSFLGVCRRARFATLLIDRARANFCFAAHPVASIHSENVLHQLQGQTCYCANSKFTGSKRNVTGTKQFTQWRKDNRARSSQARSTSLIMAQP